MNCMNVKIVATMSLLLISISLLPGCFSGHDVVFDQDTLNEMVSQASQLLNDSGDCTSDLVECSAIITFRGIKESNSITKSLVSDDPGEETIKYGFLLEQGLLANGYSIVRYFKIDNASSIGVVVTPR